MFLSGKDGNTSVKTCPSFASPLHVHIQSPGIGSSEVKGPQQTARFTARPCTREDCQCMLNVRLKHVRVTRVAVACFSLPNFSTLSR